MKNDVDNTKVRKKTNSATSKTPNRKLSLLQKIRTHFRSYCNHTSIHGFQYFGQDRTIFEKCWWILVFICIIGCCTWAICLIYDKWQQSPVIVSLTTRETPIYLVPFPAVTICPTIRFSKDCMHYAQLIKNVTVGTLGRHNIKKLDENQRNLIHYLIPLCRKNLRFIDLLDEENISDEIFEAIKKCSPFVSGQEISARFMDEYLSFNDSFRPTYTEDGLCFSFNMVSADDILRNATELNRNSSESDPKSSWIPQFGYSLDAELNTFPRRALLAGAANSLEIKLKHRKRDIDYMCTGAAQGYKVILHLPTRVPRPTLEYNMAPFGKATTISVAPHMMTTSNVVKTYDAKKRDCYFEGEKYLQFFKIYSKVNCDFECLTNYTLRECGCVPFHMPRESSTPICGIGMQPCVLFTMQKYNLMKLRSQLKESKMNGGLMRSSTPRIMLEEDVMLNLTFAELNETENVYSRKKRQLDSFDEDEEEEEEEARCSCLRSCNDITYKGSATTTDYNWRETKFDGNLTKSYDFDYSLITIYLDSNYIFTTERNELYGPTDFLSNFGGLLGLFTGFSILSFMEIIYFCTLRITGNQSLFGRWYGDNED